MGASETPNAADLQIGSGVRLLLTIEDLAAADRGPPVRARGDAVVPAVPGAGAGGDAAAGVARRAGAGRLSRLRRDALGGEA